jgi:MFS family permease
MPFMALNAIVDYIQKNIFMDKTYAQVQTAISLLNLFVLLFAILGAFIVTRRWLSKKTLIVTGLALYGATGIAALLLHNSFWNLWLYSVLIGAGSGFFISTFTSILFDNLSEKELRLAMGLQAIAVNLGGIAFGALGGLLAKHVWYGAYLLELIGLPVAILAIFTIPSAKRMLPAAKAAVKAAVKAPAKKSRLPLDVFYYAFATFIFFMLYYSCGLNIAAHLSNNGYPDPAIAGAASSISVMGGAAAGIFFSKLSSRLKELMLPVSCVLLFAGFTMLNLGQSILFLNFAAVFIAGMALSILYPYCIFAASRYADESNSATATSIVQAMAPGLGGFVSPLILTSLASSIYPDIRLMNLRYQLFGYIALALGAFFFFGNRLRKKRGTAPARSIG